MSIQINLYTPCHAFFLTLCSVTVLSKLSPSLSLSLSVLSFFTLFGPLGTWSDPALWVPWWTPWGLTWLGEGLSWSRPRSSCWDKLRLGWRRTAGLPLCVVPRVRAWHPALQEWRWAKGGCFSSAAAGVPSRLFQLCPLWRHQRGRSVSASEHATAGTESPCETCHSCSWFACSHQEKKAEVRKCSSTYCDSHT